MGMSPAPSRPTLPRARARLTMACTPWTASACWVMPIDHVRMADDASAYSRANASTTVRPTPAAAQSSSWRCVSSDAASASQPSVWASTKSSVDRVPLDQLLEHGVGERDVAAGTDRHVEVAHLGAEEERLDGGRHPVALEAGLEVRVDHDDPQPVLAGEVEVLHEDGLVVGGIRAPQHQQVGLEHVLERAGGGRDADGRLEAGRRRGVADPRRRSRCCSYRWPAPPWPRRSTSRW